MTAGLRWGCCKVCLYVETGAVRMAELAATLDAEHVLHDLEPEVEAAAPAVAEILFINAL